MLIKIFMVVATALYFVLNAKMIMLANGDASVTNAPACHASGNSETPCHNNSNCSTAEIAELTNGEYRLLTMTASERNVLADEWREAVDTMKVCAILQIIAAIVSTATVFIPKEKEKDPVAQCAIWLGAVLVWVAKLFLCVYTKDVRDVTDVCAGFEPYEDSLTYMRMMWALLVVSIAAMFGYTKITRVTGSLQSAPAQP